jgi:N-acylneuraminate cytidylyltransferase
MKVFAVIPARGGSKSLPRKNIRAVAGRPLITFSIATALQCPRIDRTLVSTDDAEIAEISRAAGAEAPFLRPAEFAQDDSTDFDVLSHMLQWLGENESAVPDAVVYLRPTEPLRRIATVQAAIEKLVATPEADSLRSVRLAQQTPYKMWRQGAEWLEPVASLSGVAEPYNQPRQKLPPIYWQDGYIDVIWSRTILEQRSSTGRRILGFVIDEPAVNIDYEDELAAAEVLLRQHEVSSSSATPRYAA